ncbi:MAG: hypothetical protein ACKV19_15325 [Verrucomicrobiales bacterium]
MCKTAAGDIWTGTLRSLSVAPAFSLRCLYGCGNAPDFVKRCFRSQNAPPMLVYLVRVHRTHRNPMHHVLAIAVAVLVASVPSQARVGETQKQITERYGEGKKTEVPRIVGAESFAYEKNGFSVEVVIHDGKSIMEIYSNRKGVTEEVIQDLLKVNTATGTKWRFDRKESKWHRQGKPKLAAYRWPGHPAFFCIMDVEACAAVEKINKPSASGL